MNDMLLFNNLFYKIIDFLLFGLMSFTELCSISIFNNIPLLGFAKQNKTLSIINQNNNDYAHILVGKPDSFFIVTVEDIEFFKPYITLN